MKLEDLPPELRDAANSMPKLGGEAYASARKNSSRHSPNTPVT